MWPGRVPEPTVRALEELLGEIGTAGQLQQRPIPRGGGIVRDEHFRRYRFADIQGTADAPKFFDFIALSTDAAFKDQATSSYVVIQAWGKRAANSYLLDQMRERMSFTKTITNLLAMRDRYPDANATLIEDKANGPAIIDSLRNKVPGIIPVEPLGSKEARAEAAAPTIQAGNIWVPHEDECRWTKAFIAEWLSVPTGAFWDQVDASGQYILKYGMRVSTSMKDALDALMDSTPTSETRGSPWEMRQSVR